jgi:hypothetical protein
MGLYIIGIFCRRKWRGMEIGSFRSGKETGSFRSGHAGEMVL